MNTEMDQTDQIRMEDLIKEIAAKNEELFKVYGDGIHCKVCNLQISSLKFHCLSEHLRTKEHLDNWKETDEVKKEVFKRILTMETLKKYVIEFGNVFETDGIDLICKICKKAVTFNKKHLIRRHLKTLRHQTFVEKDNEAQCKTQQDRELTVELLNRYVSEYNGVFETDGEILLCKVCKRSITFTKKVHIEKHLKTQNHIFKCTTSIQNLKESSFIKQKFEDFCRTCMKQFSKCKQKDDKHRITEVPKGRRNISIMNLLEGIQPQIKVKMNDNLPSLVCSDCMQNLLRTYDFIEMYQKVDKRLRKILDKFGTNEDISFDKEQKFLEEMDIKVEFNVNNVDTKVFDGLEIDKKECIELKNEPIEDVSDIEENIDFGSEDEFLPEESCIEASLNQENSNDSIGGVFKGFMKPEENADGSVTCQLCETVLDGFLRWKKHIREHHIGENHKKRSSESPEFNDSSSDQATKEVFRGFIQPEANDDGSITCQLCNLNVGNTVLWREHIYRTHLDENVKEEFKKRPKRTIVSLTINDLRNPPPNKEGRYPCEFCGKTYKNLHLYRTHIKVHTGEPYLCNQCGQTLRSAVTFHTHKLSHRAKKIYQCKKCPKSFARPDTLYSHSKTHSDRKPFVCQTCGAAFRKAHELKIHNIFHSGIKNHMCEHCDKKFFTVHCLRTHMRQHTGEKPFCCKYCGKSYVRSYDCVKHLRQHFGDKNVYPCDLCPLRFPLQRDLRAHFSSHKNDDEETRTRHLQARTEAEKRLLAKLNCKDVAEAVDTKETEPKTGS